MSEPVVDAPENTSGATDEAPAQAAETDWRAEARKWERRAKENADKLKDAAPKLTEYEQLKQQNQTAEQRLAEDLSKWQTEAQSWRKAAVGSRIEALAATEFADPSDAVAALAGNDYLDAGGQIDVEAIRRDLADVLERKPHWRRQEDSNSVITRPPAPNPAQGTSASRGAADPSTEFAAILRSQMSGR